MTENEALRELNLQSQVLKSRIQCNREIEEFVSIAILEYRKDAVDMAIKALEEIQQYRAIGTIEEFKALKEKKPKKQKSNKVIFSHDSYAYCPHCHHNVKLLWASHCDKCGGELDWKDRKLQAN